MKKLRIYLDTSVINFLYANDAPEKQEVTIEFFEHRLSDYEVAISDVVLFEIGQTKEARNRRKLMQAVARYQIPLQPVSGPKQEEVDALADAYLAARILPAAKRDDARHVAISTVFEYDVLLSWNFHHLANINKALRFNGVNEQCGYTKRLYILTPLEVISHESE